MTSKSRMYERIKDLEETNKLLGEIIKELIKKIPKQKPSRKLVKYTGRNNE
ncbi:MAG: hypothetical protein AABY22_32080 [Nanoarchaeota archaeon]